MEEAIKTFWANSLARGLSRDMRVGIEVVLKKDHLAALEEKDRDFLKVQDQSLHAARRADKYMEQVAALEAEVKKKDKHLSDLNEFGLLPYVKELKDQIAALETALKKKDEPPYKAELLREWKWAKAQIAALAAENTKLRETAELDRVLNISLEERWKKVHANLIDSEKRPRSILGKIGKAMRSFNRNDNAV